MRIDPGLIRRILKKGLEKGGDFCELYYEHRIQNSILLEENKIKESVGHVTEGVGIRVLKGERTGYAFSDIVEENPLLLAAETASKIAGNSNSPVNIGKPDKKIEYSSSVSPPVLEKPQLKSDVLIRANDGARRYSDSIAQVECRYFDELKKIEIVNSDGLWKSDEQSVLNMSVLCLAQKENIRDIGRAFAGGRYSFDLFDGTVPEELGKKAADQAVIKLDADEAPSGMLPVIISSGWGGVLVHEAVGHGLESDFHRKKTSLYTDSLGEEVASPLVTIIDDGTIANGRGTLTIDDEGTPTAKNILIEEGKLTGLLSDRINAGLLGMKLTGNGRRMSFREYPLPRMTNTFIDAGDSEENDMIKDIKRGVFAAQLGGGQVDITTGNFVFEVGQGYLIEDGKITSPIRGANLIGNGPDAMKKVVGVGKNLKIESGTGTCGKDGQGVYVGVGQPSIYISEITVGGTGQI